jgi:hypothetical protein
MTFVPYSDIALASVRLAVRDQLVLLQRLHEFAHIGLDDFPAGIELSADHIHDVRLRRPGLSCLALRRCKLPRSPFALAFLDKFPVHLDRMICRVVSR